jgi:predicted metal-dependent phosphoesterase TrpH
MSRNEQTPCRIDLHLHTGRYSQCAEFVDPYQIEARAVQAGLSAVVLTEHDILWQDEEIELLQKQSPGIRIFRGIEVSARGCHLLVIGIDDAGPLDRGITLEEVVAYARLFDAAVILAHPYRDADPDCLPVELVDAVEVGSTSFTADEARRARQLAARFGKPVVAGSDGHAMSRIGWAWTELPDLPQDEASLASAIRRGLGIPVTPYPFPV